MTLISEANFEDQVIEQLGDHGWKKSVGDDCAPHTGTRTSWNSLVHRNDFIEALKRLNPGIPAHYLNQAADDILTPSSGDALTENERIHTYLTEGYRGLSYIQDGERQDPTIYLISRLPEKNHYHAVQQVALRNRDHSRRFDIVLYVNGLPLAIMELKRTLGDTVDYGPARNQLNTYLSEFGTEFRFCAIVVATDGPDAAYGTPFTPLNHFTPWNVDEEGKPPARPGEPEFEDQNLAGQGDRTLNTPLDRLVDGLFNEERLLQLIFDYIVFEKDGDRLSKLIAKPHQYFAVAKAIGATVTAHRTDGRAGVVWHTQGSGKSLEMALYANSVMRRPELKNPTIVVITDRTELDGQLFASFQRNTLLPEEPKQITSREGLRTNLAANNGGGILFTTLQKFGTTDKERQTRAKHPKLSDRNNIIVVVDEAHRSHYDDIDGYARHLRDALPHATLIAFTGTPLSGTKDTQQVFGDYIDVYDLTRAVQDGATVPVYYEPRHVVLKGFTDVSEDEINEAAEALTADLDEEERTRIVNATSNVQQIYAAPERVQTVAEDVVNHWEKRRKDMAPMVGGPGKAMLVCASREICVAVYDELAKLRPDWHHDNDDKGLMKVVFSGAAHDPDHFQPHIRRPSAEKMVKARAADADDELQIIIVKDMLLTGFDSPSLHTLYLDRPMQGALLMQTLARVNRTFQGKKDGLLVAYSPITQQLEAALGEYTISDQENRPIGKDVSEAAAGLRQVLGEVDTLTAGYPWRTSATQDPEYGLAKASVGMLNHLLEPAPVEKTSADPDSKSVPRKQRYRELTGQLQRLWSLAHGAVTFADSEKQSVEFYEYVRKLLARHESEERRAQGQPVPEDVKRSLTVLVDDASTGDGVVDLFDYAGLPKVRLDALSPELLQQLQETPPDALQLVLSKLKNLLSEATAKTTSKNLTKQKYFAERIKEALNQYTNANLTSAEVIKELYDLAIEARDSLRRGEKFDPPLAEDELALYDALGNNDSAQELMADDTLAKIARELVQTLRKDSKTDWSVRDDVRARMRSAIKRLLKKYKYPPDQEASAIKEVLQQLEVLSPGHVL